MLSDIGKAFARTGQDIHVRELRAGLLPPKATMVLGFLSGWIVTLLPWLVTALFRLGLSWSSEGYAANGEMMRAGSALRHYLIETWHYGLLIGLLGIGLAWLRRYSARKNRYLVFQIGAGHEFRFGYDEIGAVIGIAAILFLLSETAWFFSIFTIFAAMLIGIVWHELHDLLLRMYASVRNDYGPEVIFAVWEVLKRNDIARDAKIKGVGARDRGRTVILSGIIPIAAEKELTQRLPIVVKGVEAVLLTSDKLSVDDGFEPLAKKGKSIAS